MGNDKMGGKAQFSYSCAPLLTQILIKLLCLSYPIAQSMLDWLEKTQKITSIHSLICPVNIYRHNPLIPTHFTLLHIMSTMHNYLYFLRRCNRPPPFPLVTKSSNIHHSNYIYQKITKERNITQWNFIVISHLQNYLPTMDYSTLLAPLSQIKRFLATQ